MKKPTATDNNTKKPAVTDENTKKPESKKKQINWSAPGPDRVIFENYIRYWINKEEDYYDIIYKALELKMFATTQGIPPNIFGSTQIQIQKKFSTLKTNTNHNVRRSC